MVGHLVSLKWAHLVASLKRSGWAIAGTIIGTVYGLLALFMVLTIMMSQRGEDPVVAQSTAVVLGTVVAVLWCIVPLVLSGQDSTLDPDILAPFPLRPREILGGQLIGSVISIAGAITLIGAFLPVVTWESVGPAVTAVFAGILSFGLLMICSRLMSAVGMAIRNRRFLAEAIGAVFFLALLCAGPLLGALTDGLFSTAWTTGVASVTGWTPLGAPWALPGDVAEGAWGILALRGVVTLAYICAGLFVWLRVIAHQTSHVGAASGTRSRGSRTGIRLGLFGRFPATPVGGIAARMVTYYLKDPRLNLNLLFAPGFLLLFWFVSGAEGGGQLLLVGPLVGWMLAWQSTYTVSYDNTAFALHLTAPISGLQERWGRSLGMCAIFVPLVGLTSVIAMLLAGTAGSVPANLGVSLSLLLSGLGVGAAMSVRYALPVAAPGESPWKSRKNNAGFVNALFQLLGSLLILAVALPIWALLIVFAVTGNPVIGWSILVAGPVYGLLILWLGVRIGAAWYERRAPELYQDVAKFR